MTLLQIKAKIYRYTGIYLAKSEEQIHMYCSPFKPGNYLYSLELSSWQIENGFHRHIGMYYKEVTKHKLMKNYTRHIIYSVLDYCSVVYVTLLIDLEK